MLEAKNEMSKKKTDREIITEIHSENLKLHSLVNKLQLKLDETMQANRYNRNLANKYKKMLTRADIPTQTATELREELRKVKKENERLYRINRRRMAIDGII